MAGQKKRQSVGRPGSIPSRVPRIQPGFPRWLTLENAAAVAKLRHQCEEGTVPLSIFLKLLDRGYRKPPKGEAFEPTRMPFIGTDGRPWNWQQQQRDTAARFPQTTQSRSFTLGNPVVRRRLQREWEDGTIHPAICKWVIEHGRDLRLKETAQDRRMPFIGRRGLPWQHDVMKEQQDRAIAYQKAEREAEARARHVPGEAQKEPAAGEQEAGETDVLEVYKEEKDRG